MNNEYIKELYDEYKDNFKDIDIECPEDLKDLIGDYITSNMQFDFDVDVDLDRLFNNNDSKTQESIEEEIEK